MKTWKTQRLLLLGLLTATATLTAIAPASAQTIFKTMRAFGIGDLSSSLPTGGLVELTNGTLCGVTISGGDYGSGTVFAMNKDGSGRKVIHSFTGRDGDGYFPSGSPLKGAEGVLYGTTSGGGISNLGTIYRVGQDGTGYAVLKNFTGTATDGAVPFSGVTLGVNGSLYGTTFNGGQSNLGTIFVMKPDGSGFKILRSFVGSPGDGAKPTAGLLQAVDGELYGTTTQGGANNQGTIFRIRQDGSTYEVIKSFTGMTGDGAQPHSPLAQGSDGTLYGTTYTGGTSAKGTAFKLMPDGTGFQVLKSFSGASGANPVGTLLLGTNGVLYGATLYGGSSTNGTLFQLNSDGTGFRVLKSYPATVSDGQQPNSPILQASDGLLYATTAGGGAFGSGTAFRLDPVSTQYVLLISFSDTGGDGVNPHANLVLGNDDALYGTSQDGGANDQGAVFRISRDGSSYSVLKSFTGTNGDGAIPSAGLVQGRDGALYGTAMWDNETRISGASVVNGNGTVFKLNLDGSGYRVIKKFLGGADGANPYGVLLQANDGLLYGTTMRGGSKLGGTVFRLHLDGSGYSVIKNFLDTGSSDGYAPYAGLIQGSDNTLYGTTSAGGTGSRGTLFKVALDGTGYSVIKNFTGATNDGAVPWAPLLQAKDGALYGTTLQGGAKNQGTVFTLKPDGSGFAVVRSLTVSDGESPMAGLIQGSNGILYGTTSVGGNPDILSGVGTAFQLNPDGSDFLVLKVFQQLSGEGVNPQAGLVQSADGTLYGTTSSGGKNNTYGTVFSLLPPAILSVASPARTELQLKISGPYGRSYTVERSTSTFGPWAPVGSVTIGTNSAEVLIDRAPLPEHAFYRTVSP